jgi:hypothetical protein
MSKNETVQFTNNIEKIMAELGTPSLKAFAGVFDLNPVRFYSVAKQPKEGVVYDAKVFNWDAIERFITRRLDAEKGLATLEDVVKAALVVEEELKQSDGRRSSNRGEGSAYGAKIEVDGKMVAKRRFANFEMENGQLVTLKKDPEVYAIVLQTASHTVLRPVNSADPTDFKGNDVKVISNGMLNFKGTGPSALEASIKERLSGEYAKKLADEAAKAAAAAAAKVPANAEPSDAVEG